MQNHRQNADISDLRISRPSHLHEWCAGLVIAFIILALYLTAQVADDRAEAAERDAERAMRTDVEAAYERGMSDAVSALHDSPDSTRLAQACAAHGVARP